MNTVLKKECKFLIEAGSCTGWIDLSYLSFSQEDCPRGTGFDNMPAGDSAIRNGNF